MARKVLFSFHYDDDSWRVAKVRNMGIVEGSPLLSGNDWDEVKRGGKPAIKSWIDRQMVGRECTVVLIGAETADREFVRYEIEQSWKLGMGLVGIYINNISDDRPGYVSQTSRGRNPFAGFTVGQTDMSSIVKTYDPPYYSSSDVYNYIAANLSQWVEEAIAIRKRY